MHDAQICPPMIVSAPLHPGYAKLERGTSEATRRTRKRNFFIYENKRNTINTTIILIFYNCQINILFSLEKSIPDCFSLILIMELQHVPSDDHSFWFSLLFIVRSCLFLSEIPNERIDN